MNLARSFAVTLCVAQCATAQDLFLGAKVAWSSSNTTIVAETSADSPSNGTNLLGINFNELALLKTQERSMGGGGGMGKMGMAMGKMGKGKNGMGKLGMGMGMGKMGMGSIGFGKMGLGNMTLGKEGELEAGSSRRRHSPSYSYYSYYYYAPPSHGRRRHSPSPSPSPSPDGRRRHSPSPSPGYYSYYYYGPSPAPGPAPGPIAPAPSSGQFCWDEQPGWPKFNSVSDLQNDQQGWASYFQLVYGEVPSTGYPICVGSFRMLYLDALKQAGVQAPQLGGACASSAGEMFKFGQSLFDDGKDAGGMSYTGVGIWHPDQNRFALPSNTWVEITHAKTSEEKVGAWFYYMPGSGVWFNTANTLAFSEHKDSADHFLGGSHSCTECDSITDEIFQKACSSGVQSVQYVEHGEDDWHGCKSKSGTTSLAIEIVDTCGQGKYSCAGSTWKAGWGGSKDCSCDEGKGAYNCQGYVPNW